MSEDKQKRRLNRQFAVTWFLLLLTILAVLYMALAKPRVETHNLVGQQGPQGESIVGPIGPAGESVKGKDGKDGLPGQQTVIENQTTVYHTETVKGEKGDPGLPGEAAPVLQIQVNPESRNLEYKYSTDTFWSTLLRCEELLIGCEDGSPNE